MRKLGLATGLTVLGVGAAGIAPAGALTPEAPLGCTTSTVTAIDITPTAITDVATTTDSLVVAGLGPRILDVDVITFLDHTFPGDLDITVTSPAGTVVTLTTDNGASNDNVFGATNWDDQAQTPVTDYTGFTLGVPVPTLSPEEPLGAFFGEDPNGNWTITIRDDTAIDTGTLNQWQVRITTIDGPLLPVAQTVINTVDVPIPTGPATVQQTVNLGNLPYILDVDVLTNITHAFNADLDIELVSPLGTVVTLSTDNGGSNDNVFVGQIWNDDANPGGQVPYTTNAGMVTDHPYANLVPAGVLTPEEPLSAFNGEDPNGTWTLRITDDLAGDGGTLHDFAIRVTGATCADNPPPIPPDPGLPEPPVVVPPASDDVDVVAGADRIETAIKVSQASFGDDEADAVVIARRDDFPDALAGTPLAAAKGGPLLLSSPSALEANVEAEIARVLPGGGDIYLLGGTAALGPNVGNRLAGLGYAVHRIFGENRFETAVEIAEALGSPQTVLEASGLNFPDAVSAGAAAIVEDGAILLTNGSSQSAATAGYLAANPGAHRFAVGGPAAAADPDADELVGADRFATSALVATRFFPAPTIAGVASGRSFPDALTGGVQIGVLGGPMLLTEPGDLPAPITDFLDANFEGIDQVIVYGGSAAVSQAVIDEIADAIT